MARNSVIRLHRDGPEHEERSRGNRHAFQGRPHDASVSQGFSPVALSRKEIKSARVRSFLMPENRIRFPGMNFFGFASHPSSVAAFQTTPDCRNALE